MGRASLTGADSSIRFLRENKVSDIAAEASARLFISDEKERAEVVGAVRRQNLKYWES